MQKQPFIVLDGKECGTMFVLAIVVQLLLIYASPELVMFAEKIGRRLKLNLGVAALALTLAAYAYFWLNFWPMMNSLGVNLTLGTCQIGSLYVAVACLRKLHESDDKSPIAL